jgi:hypothetical protein
MVPSISNCGLQAGNWTSLDLYSVLGYIHVKTVIRKDLSAITFPRRTANVNYNINANIAHMTQRPGRLLLTAAACCTRETKSHLQPCSFTFQQTRLFNNVIGIKTRELEAEIRLVTYGKSEITALCVMEVSRRRSQ